MTISEALDRVIAQSGHVRYRDLCDPAHPDYQPGYVEMVLVMASSPRPIGALHRPVEQPTIPRPPAVAVTLNLIQRIRACPHWVKASCGCMPNRCRLGKGDQGHVSLDDCRRCLES